ncbi:MAG: alpha/beta hydrolase [Pseudomonadota bacterium]
MPRFTTDDGLSLHFEDDGGGLPLLCLAGLARNSRDFEPLMENFANRVRIIRIDARGRGDSDYDPDYQNYNVIREGSDAIALLDHLGLEQAAVLGTSRGGLIAMTLAIGHAKRLLGVMLNDVGPVIETAGLAYIMDYIGKGPADRDYDSAAERLERVMPPVFTGVSRAEWRRYAERLWVEKPGGLDNRYDAALRRAVLEQSASGAAPDLWPMFNAVAKLPHGLIRGANSNILSAKTAAEMQSEAPGMVYAEVPGRGHVPFLNEPEAISALNTWMEQMQ